MGNDYQLRRDIDKLFKALWNNDTDSLNLVSLPIFMEYMKQLGMDREASKNFNCATLDYTKTENDTTVRYVEYWILSNAYYDYDVGRFVKIDKDSNSFGIQIQAKGTYAGEQALGYIDNTSIGVWRNPSYNNTWMDTTNYNYDDYINYGYIGAKEIATGKWVEFAVGSGWLNNFMIDAYGGMTIGGAGFEVDGNGIFPFTRLTSSKYSDGTDEYALLGLLDNAYHSMSGCDDNSIYSWFVGLKTPINSSNIKNNSQASFVVMYNDNASKQSGDDSHKIYQSDWHIVFEVNTSGIVQ